MKTIVEVRRYPSKGEFPKQETEYHVFVKNAGKDIHSWYKYDCETNVLDQQEYWENTFDYWLESVELDEEELKKPYALSCYATDRHLVGVADNKAIHIGIDIVLNKLK